ncbi:MAG: ATP-binding cassette domain-containing protein [Gemmataceae bacterium]|nr:ATP-binding cassette domain-containing protein [Gemmata sp.]MDW8196472.1 ATP-binding cassette domain-containing protein [Gemmataceae bacterium]
MNRTLAYRLENVAVQHGWREVLHLPTLEVFAGEILCLVGPPGSGKSTLLRLLAGLQRPSRGQVWFHGELLNYPMPITVQRTITLVFQRPLLLTGTVRSNVEYGLRIRGDAQRHQKALAILERMHLAHLADRPASAISGGEAQLVAVARALAIAPEVLLLDEPTNNLDPARVALVEEVVLADHKLRGTTVVWATHNHFQARRAGSRVALLLDGRLIETAAATDFFAMPRDARTAAFIQGQMVY